MITNLGKINKVSLHWPNSCIVNCHLPTILSYTLVEPADDNFGSQDEAGNWNGLMAMILKQVLKTSHIQFVKFPHLWITITRKYTNPAIPGRNFCKQKYRPSCCSEPGKDRNHFAILQYCTMSRCMYSCWEQVLTFQRLTLNGLKNSRENKTCTELKRPSSGGA